MRILRCGFYGGFTTLCAALTLTLSFSAVAKDKDAAASGFYEEAVQSFNEENYDETVIHLKNALHENPKLLPAMVMLGNAYLRTGNPAAAEAALSDAVAVGADPALIAIPLARTYILQFKHELLLAQSVNSNLPPAVRSELHVLRARAAMEINAREHLSQEVTLAEDINPSDPELLALKVTIALREGDLTKAQELANLLVESFADRADSWLASASVKHIRGNLAGALNDYGKVIKIEPLNSSALIARIGLLLDLGRDEETSADFIALGKATASDPRVHYLRAIKLARAGDQHGSKQALNEVINVIDALGPDIVNRNFHLLMAAGNASLALNNLESARLYFETYLETAGSELAPRQLLAGIYLSQQEYRSAATLLETIVAALPENVQMLSMLAEAYQGLEDGPKAVAVLERATTISAENPRLETQLAISRMQAGFSARGLADLQKAFSRESGGVKTIAGLPLAVTSLQTRDYDTALRVARELERAAPTEVTYKNIIGIALAGKGRLAEAQSVFEEILALRPDYSPATINIAKIEASNANFAKAETILKQLLDKHPDDSRAMVELSRLDSNRGNMDGALRWARNAAQLSPQDISTQSYLIQLLIQNGNPAEALKIALQLDSVIPDNYLVQKILVKTQLAADKASQAKSTLRGMASAAEFNAEKLVEIGQLQAMAGSLEDASYTLFKALQGNPDNIQAQVAIVETEIRLDRLDDALIRAQNLQQQLPDMATGYRLAGDALMRMGQPAAAAKEYQLGLAKSPDNRLVMLLYTAHRRNANLSAAESTLTDWLNAQPNDLLVRNALAEFYLSTGAYQKAKPEYNIVIAARPNDAQVLNNYANLLLRLNELKAALESAQSALTLAPDNPAINDTVGWLLVKQNSFNDGIGYLREALSRAAGSPEIRYHLAVALHGLGRNNEAVKELQRALADKSVFEERSEAQLLLEKLRS